MMIQLFRFVAVSLWVVMCGATLVGAADNQQGGVVVAIVKGATLTKADLGQEVGRILPQTRSMHGQLSAEKMVKIRGDAMKILVETELRFQDAQAKGMKLTDDDLEKEIAVIAKNYKSDKAFEAALEANGFDKKRFVRLLKREGLASRIRKAEVEDKITITDAGVKDFYAKNIAMYSKPEEFRASQIYLKVDPAAPIEDKLAMKKRAEALLKRIKEGGDFADIAAQESDDNSRIKGGDLGYFHSGQVLSEFESILVKMRIGQVSDVVETIYGLHIILLTDRKPPRLVPFEEMQAKIKKDLVESERQLLLEKWMSGLKAKAVITYPGAK